MVGKRVGTGPRPPEIHTRGCGIGPVDAGQRSRGGDRSAAGSLFAAASVRDDLGRRNGGISAKKRFTMTVLSVAGIPAATRN